MAVGVRRRLSWNLVGLRSRNLAFEDKGDNA